MNFQEYEALYTNVPPLPLDRRTGEWLFSLWRKSQENMTEPRILSREEAKEDVETFFLLLKYFYSGYEYYQTQVDFAELQRQIISSLPDSAPCLGNILFDALSPYIDDGHFAIQGDGKWYRAVSRPHRAFFSDALLEVRNGKYTVLNGANVWKTGEILSEEEIREHLFETLPAPNGNRRYLLGVYTQTPVDSLHVAGVTLSLHPCKTDKRLPSPGAAREEIVCGVPVVQHRTYNLSALANFYGSTDQAELKSKYQESGMRYRGEKQLILSVLSNGGGSANFPYAFFMGLNEYAQNTAFVARTLNPCGDPSSFAKRYVSHSPEPADRTKGAFAGKLFVLQNDGTMSAGDWAVLYAKSLRDVCFVGSATRGNMLFGEVHLFELPHSRMYFGCGSKVFWMEEREKNHGFFPDYWLDSDTPVEDVAAFCSRQI